jgi:photosystem II stability/assembly factor-like uncharacterized protein
MRVLVLVGTRKGGFVLEGDQARRSWQLRGPFFPGWEIRHITHDPRDRSLYAAANTLTYGALVGRSADLGATWTHSSEGLTYGKNDEGPKLKRVWHLKPGRQAGEVYAGVEEAGLFHSRDAGQSWQHLEGLRRHASTPTWEPGGGGLCLHTIVPHSTDPLRMWVGISAAGVFHTADGGSTWEAQNQGVLAPWRPEGSVTGQCVHKIAPAPSGDRIYQQNHVGIYRTDDGGRTWIDISAGLPSRFGFCMVAHPRDAESAWVLPLTGDDQRFVPDGQVAVWRTRDAGRTWRRTTAGLPSNAWVVVLRDGMHHDALDPLGLYFGTSTGQLFASRDEGESWAKIADHLPPIMSVAAALV